MPKRKVLFIDIETAPMHVRLWDLKIYGRYVSPRNIVQSGFVLTFAAKWEGEKHMTFVKSCDGHDKMLQAMHRLLSQADAVVHYNGKKFDIPTLNAEFLLHNLPPLENLPVQIDLLPMVRRVFKLPSYSLDFVCQKLRLGRKVRHEGIELWEKCEKAMKDPKDQVWDRMARYNKHDVTLLARLYKVMRPWFKYAHGYKRINEWLLGMRSNP